MNTKAIVQRGVLWNTTSNILGKCVVFANLFLILHHLSVYEYGLSELLLSIVTTLSFLYVPGLGAALTADMARERAEGRKDRIKILFIQYALLICGLGILGWASLFFGASYAATQLTGNASLADFVQIISFIFLISPLRNLSTLVASVELRFADLALFSLVEESVKFFLLLTMFFGFGFGVSGLLYAIVGAQALAVLIYLPRTISACATFMGARAGVAQFAFWNILRLHRKWGVVGNYVSGLGQSTMLWIIRFTLGTEAVGLYAFGIGIIGQLSSFFPLPSILASLVPQQLGDRVRLARIVRTSIKAQMVLAVLMCVGAFILLPVLFVIFPKYVPALPIVQIMLLCLIPNAAILLLSVIFPALKAQFSYMLSAGIKVALGLVLLPVCILLFGVVGVAIATVLVFIFSAIERTWRLGRTLPEFSFPIREFVTLSADDMGLLRNYILPLLTQGPIGWLTRQRGQKTL